MTTIPVGEIFTSIQGEGINSGRASVFLRVAGCNLKCEWCDTALYRKKSSGVYYQIDSLAFRLSGVFYSHPDITHLVITGGEPSLYPKELINLLLSTEIGDFIRKFGSIEIETNGLDVEALGRLSSSWTRFTVSPKFEFKKKYSDLPHGSNVTYKLIVDGAKDAEKQLEWISGKIPIDVRDIFLQPKNNSRAIALELSERDMLGCRLSLQLHKILGIA
jgi:7-carboxy-7-deazaguanine synthase